MDMCTVLPCYHIANRGRLDLPVTEMSMTACGFPGFQGVVRPLESTSLGGRQTNEVIQRLLNRFILLLDSHQW
mgnify:CR=1 FL=1